MDRRKALKGIGIGVASTVYSGSILSLLQSCKQEAALNLEWTPTFLDTNQAYLVKEALAIILPETDTPGALSLGIPQFIDKYLDQVSSDEERNHFTQQANKFQKQIELNSSKKIGELTKEDFQAIIEKNFDGTENRDNAYEFLSILRGQAVRAWKNSELIGENVLWYDPIPGKWKACRLLNEDGEGRLSSLSW